MQTTRRGFLGILTTIGAALGFYDDAYSKDTLNLQYYRGYRLKWTGWKESKNDGRHYAQWTATPETNGKFDCCRPSLYTAIPEEHGRPGLEPGTHPAVKEREKKRAGKRLIRLIDDFYEGKITWSPDPVTYAELSGGRYRRGDVIDIEPFVLAPTEAGGLTIKYPKG